MEPNKFWMLLVEGGGMAHKVHPTREGAMQEAERLARKEETTVFLMEAVGICRVGKIVSPVRWEKLLPSPNMGVRKSKWVTRGVTDVDHPFPLGG